jgi:hypothetical protein
VCIHAHRHAQIHTYMHTYTYTHRSYEYLTARTSTHKGRRLACLHAAAARAYWKLVDKDATIAAKSALAHANAALNMHTFLSKRTQAQMCRLAGEAQLAQGTEAIKRFAEALKLWGQILPALTMQNGDTADKTDAVADRDKNGAELAQITRQKNVSTVAYPGADRISGNESDRKETLDREVAVGGAEGHGNVFRADRRDVREWARAMRGTAVALLRKSTNGKQRVEEVRLRFWVVCMSELCQSAHVCRWFVAVMTSTRTHVHTCTHTLGTHLTYAHTHIHTHTPQHTYTYTGNRYLQIRSCTTRPLHAPCGLCAA